MKKSIWQNCYDLGWTGSIISEAFSHPAKFSRGLIQKIYQHTKEMGWIKPGDWVLDPFAGVALGGLDALSMELNWIGIELEQKFVDMATGFECDGKVESHKEMKHFDYVPGGWYVRLRMEAAYWGKSLKKMFGGWDEDEGFDSEQEAKETRQKVYELDGRDRYFNKAYTVIYEAPEVERDEIVRIIDKPAHCGKTEIHDPHHILGNFELWNRQLKGWHNLGTARIVRGDSRRLKEYFRKGFIHDNFENQSTCAHLEVIGGQCTRCAAFRIEKTDIVISSPPFHDSRIESDLQRRVANPKVPFSDDTGIRNYGHTPGNLANLKEGKFEMVGSPPWIDKQEGAGFAGPSSGMWKGYQPGFKKTYKSSSEKYGQSPGQLGSMKEGSFDLCVGSPPYAEQSIQKNSPSIDRKKQYETYRKQGGGASFEAFCKTQDLHSCDYGSSEGQLASLPEGSFDLCVSSPPWEKGATGGLIKFKNSEDYARQMSEFAKINPRSHGGSAEAYLRKMEKDSKKTYGNSQNQLGNSSGDTFWSASREIVQQCFDLLKPNGHAIWVCKDYVKNKKRVPFSDRWLALCESVGFKLVCRHQAMLVKEYGKQKTIRGDEEIIQIERKSFFRRLAESKGSPRIDNEDVICLEKI